MIFKKRIQKFKLDTTVRLGEIYTPDVNLGELGTLKEEYGFKAGDLAHNFFKSSDPKRKVYVLYTGSQIPTNLRSTNVVARIWGVQRQSRNVVEFEIWHLSSNPSHSLNDSQGGKRWGVYGLTKVDGSKVRWKCTDTGENVTKKTCQQIIRGSPNPYVTKLLKLSLEDMGCTSARQHEASPCSQLFDNQYSHSTHPQIMMIYTALGFKRPVGLDFYAWDAMTHRSLERSWKSLIFKMGIGIPVVYPTTPCTTFTSGDPAC